MIQNRPAIHRGLFYFALLLIAVGLPLSKFLVSVAQFILIGNWILEGNYIPRFKLFFQNKIALLLFSVLILHIISGLYSENTSAWFHDAKVKVPLALLPLIFITTEKLRTGWFKWLVLFFVAALIVKTFTAFGHYCTWWGKTFLDVREITVNISPIRLSLMLCLAIVLLFHFFFESSSAVKKSTLILVCLWFVFFMVLIKSITGLFCLSAVFLCGFMFYFRRKKKSLLTLLFGSVFIGSMAFFTVKSVMIYNEYFRLKPAGTILPDSLTASGNAYHHDKGNTSVENGYPVMINICDKELKSEWSRRSPVAIGQLDKKGNELYYTLVRYLSSKGLRKDSAAIASLTDEEVRAIEYGAANVVYYEKGPLTSRIHQVIWEINEYAENRGNPSGHSVTQRLEFWKAGWNIWMDHFIFGIGSGDLGDAFEKEYEKMGTPLKKDFRIRTHNQYLAIAVGLGAAGLLLFFFSLVYPLFTGKRFKDLVYMSFFIIVVLSMLTEDTLETQVGVTFYAFFNSLFLFQSEKEE